MRSDNSNSPPLPSSFDEEGDDFFQENRLAKLGRKLKEEPLVPLGCALTVWALYKAARSSRSITSAASPADAQAARLRTNMYFRRRVYAQAFTLAAVVTGGLYWSGDRERRKEYEKVQKAAEMGSRRDRWIAELEFRDEEEKRQAAQARAGRQIQAAGARLEKDQQRLDKEREQEIRETSATKTDPVTVGQENPHPNGQGQVRSVVEEAELRVRLNGSSILRQALSHLW